MLPGDSVLINGCWWAALSVVSQGNGCVASYHGSNSGLSRLSSRCAAGQARGAADAYRDSSYIRLYTLCSGYHGD